LESSQRNSLLTYFRKGKLQKFYLATGGKSREFDFMSAAKLLEADQTAKREKLGADYYDLLDKNKLAFTEATTEDMPDLKLKGGRDTATRLLKILKAIRDYRQFADDQEDFIKKVMRELESGGLPKQTAKKALKEMNTTVKQGASPLQMLGILQKNIPPELLKAHIAESAAYTFGPREVILSEYLIGE
jgi:hypothetical protein